MKKFLIVCVVCIFAYPVYSQGWSPLFGGGKSKSQSQSNEWNAFYSLYNPKVRAEYKDPSDNSTWVLVIGESVADRSFNNQQDKEMGDFHNSLLMFEKTTRKSIVIPNYLIQRGQNGGSGSEGFINAFFSKSEGGSFPQYVYYELPTYATDNEVYRYDIQTREIKVIQPGSLIGIFPSGNLYIQQTGFATDKAGNTIPGRGTFDMVVTPQGKIAWKSSIYYD